MTAEAGGYGRILYRLKYAERPVTLAQLAKWSGLSRRETERSVQELRSAGHPIGSDSRGIWLAKDRSQALEAYRRLRSRFLTQATTARAVLRAAQRIEDPEQPSLWADL